MPERRRKPLPDTPPQAPLHSRDELYRLLVENVTDYAILVLSPDGRVATWTEGAERMTLWTEDEILGQSVAVLYPPEDAGNGAPERDLRIATCASPRRRGGARRWRGASAATARACGPAWCSPP